MTDDTNGIKLKSYMYLFLAGVITALVLVYKVNFIGKENRATAHRHQLYKSCVENAGQYVFRQVDGVKGVAQLRLREWAGHRADWDSLSDYPYDMYGYSSGSIAHSDLDYVGDHPNSFSFFESIIPSDKFKHPRYYRNDHRLPPIVVDSNARFRRYSGYSSDTSKMKEEHVAALLSRYGFTFQETHTEEDDLFDVIGSDLIVVDIATGEVLGLRKAYWSRAEINASSICPFGVDWNSSSKFVSKVLIADIPNGVDK
jgi:hypothetical protein